MKAIAVNILLAQSLGICNAYKAQICPVGIIGNFIRVHDNIGIDSLFQAEVRRCAEIIKTVADHTIPALVFLDEPMHSTPPTEGAATAMAVCDYLGRLPHVRVVATTHYHVLSHLDPAYFANVSIEAIRGTTGFIFPYKLKKGASGQCIALELLNQCGDANMPSAVIRSAIEIKDKICKRVLDVP
jgi:DNA mismatch repair ATPase MutS